MFSSLVLLWLSHLVSAKDPGEENNIMILTCKGPPCHRRGQGSLVNPFGYAPLSDVWLHEQVTTESLTLTTSPRPDYFLPTYTCFYQPNDINSSSHLPTHTPLPRPPTPPTYARTPSTPPTQNLNPLLPHFSWRKDSTTMAGISTWCGRKER